MYPQNPSVNPYLSGAAVPLVIVNDRAYGTIRARQRARGFPAYSLDLQPVDYAQVARACGLHGVTVSDRTSSGRPAAGVACGQRDADRRAGGPGALLGRLRLHYRSRVTGAAGRSVRERHRYTSMATAGLTQCSY